MGADIINKAERKGSASNLVLVTDMHFAAESPEADFLEGVASQLKNGEVNLQVLTCNESVCWKRSQDGGEFVCGHCVTT